MMSTARADPGERAFLGTAALLFASGVAVTVHGCMAMSMSMPWMPMPGQSWPGAAAAFLGMWIAMMVAMMLPSLLPMLRRYRRSVRHATEAHLGQLTALVGLGYFAVWSAFGLVAFALGVVLMALEMRVPGITHAIPFMVSVLFLLAGALQFSAWKARHLACCRGIPGRDRILPADAGTAWRHGLRCGLHCTYSCAGLTAVLFGLGVMDLRAMAAVTVAITIERLAPGGERFARAIGVVVIGTGLLLLFRAAGF